MKVALVVDWLEVYGGAERVISSLHRVFRFKKTYTLINLMKEHDLKKIYGEDDPNIQETFLKVFGGKFRWLFFIFHLVVEKISIKDDAEVIISSSHAIAKGIKKKKGQLHISYFQCRNFKYIWDERKLYFGKVNFLLSPLVFVLRKLDVRQAQYPDHIIVNSHYVQDWVLKTYGRESEVVYPPVDISGFTLENGKDDYYIVVGRLEPIKRLDLVIEAFNTLKKKLIVVGDGTEYKYLKSIANDNIEFVGFLESNQISEYLRKAKGFIHSARDDFGIAPVEAQACGTPVIAYGEGAVLETVKGVFSDTKIEIDSTFTGVFFKEQNSDHIIEAVKFFEKNEKSFDYSEIRKNAERFSTENFEKNIKAKVEELLRKER